MNEVGERDPEQIERQNRALQRKLTRTERKLETLEILQQQNANLMRALMTELGEERAESERLLLNILPAAVAQRLKAEPGIIADRFDAVSVLFLDIAGSRRSQRPSRPNSWSHGSMRSTRCSMLLSKITTSRRSARSATGTWWRRVFHSRKMTMPLQSPVWHLT